MPPRWEAAGRVSQTAPLGFNRFTVADYAWGSAFVLFAPLCLLPFAALPIVGIVVFAALCVAFARFRKRRRFWTLPALGWACFLGLGVGLSNSDVPDALALEGVVPLSAEQVGSAPEKGPFLVGGVVLDEGHRGRWEKCRDPLDYDPYRQPFRYNVADPPEICNSASVVALRGGRSKEVVAWVLRDDRAWPKFFGDGPVLAFTMQLGGVLGSRSEAAEQARENACERWKLKQDRGEIVLEEPCPQDAPILLPVSQSAEILPASRVMSVSVLVWQIYTVIGWLILGIRALRRRIRP